MNLSKRLKLMTLQQKWEEASDEERPEIEQEIQAIKNGHSAAKEPEKKPAPAKSDPPASKSKEGSQDKKPVIPALKDLPHADYCGFAELVPMVQLGEKGWMTYKAYRTKHPDRNIFDIDPGKVAVMYLNQEKYSQLDSGDSKEIMSKCMRQLPAAYMPIETAILNGLIFAEAQYDPRIKKLGYKGETMYDFDKNKLFIEYYDGVIYNVLHAGMTLEKARAYARGEEVDPPKSTPEKQPDPPKKQSGQPKSTQPGDQGTKPKTKPAPTPQTRKPGQTIKQVNRPQKNFARMTF